MFVSLNKTKSTKHFQSAPRLCWPELQPSVYYFSGSMNSSRKILWRICGHCPGLLSTVINSLTSRPSHHHTVSPSHQAAALNSGLKSGKIVTSTRWCGDWPRPGIEMLAAWHWAERRSQWSRVGHILWYWLTTRHHTGLHTTPINRTTLKNTALIFPES